MMPSNPYHLSREVGRQLARLDWRVAVAESCTGGGVAYHLTSVAGASRWFERGFVTYTGAAKQDLLGVPADILQAHGEVSAQTASAMARGVLAHSPADISVSITGIAGPTGGSPDKPVGTVYFGLALRAEAPQVEWRHAIFDSGRQHVRDSAISFALAWLLEVITNQSAN